MIAAGSITRWARGGMLATLLLATPALAAAADLTMGVTVSAMVGTTPVATGVEAVIQSGTTTGYDPGVDSLAYRVGPLQAWMLNGSAPFGAQEMKRDVRAGLNEERWQLQVLTPSDGTGAAVTPGDWVTISWNPPLSGGVCSGRAMSLTDLQTATVVDMAGASDYRFVAPASGVPYDLDLVVGAAGGVSQAVPAAPSGLVSPQQGRRGVLLTWSPLADAGVRYHVERISNPRNGATRQVSRITPAPQWDSRWLDTETIAHQEVAYRVIAMSGAGCESLPSTELLVFP